MIHVHRIKVPTDGSVLKVEVPAVQLGFMDDPVVVDDGGLYVFYRTNDERTTDAVVELEFCVERIRAADDPFGICPDPQMHGKAWVCFGIASNSTYLYYVLWHEVNKPHKHNDIGDEQAAAPEDEFADMLRGLGIQVVALRRRRSDDIPPDTDFKVAG